VFNGCQLENGKVRRGVLPRKFLPAIQVVEYIRAFFGGRIGWESIDATVLISGAFTLFNRHALIAGGGYREGDVTEDFEVILRIRGALMRAGRRCRVAIIPDPLCWTQVPDNWRDLRRQRRRWQMGAVLTLRRYWFMIFNPRYGTVGMCVLPYMLLFEIISPLAELIAYAALALQLGRGALEWELFALWLGIGLGFSTFISMMSAYLEESFFARHQPRRHFFWFLGFSLLENFGYRQMQLLLRLEGLWRALTANSEWGAHTRREFARSFRHPNQAVELPPSTDQRDPDRRAG
jgi:cellulose synthase/poly-beta-1,6-N-acetylglucosamine synthase-like glycosyltransferase